jgi:hypothetical protein
MSIFVESTGFGYYEMTVNALNREDAIELANLLRSSNTKYLQEIGIELESELMELKD